MRNDEQDKQDQLRNLQRVLALVGVSLPLDVLEPWTEQQRDDAGVWALGRRMDPHVPCSHEGAAGVCMPRVSDGRCIWCERDMCPPAHVVAATRTDAAKDYRALLASFHASCPTTGEACLWCLCPRCSSVPAETSVFANMVKPDEEKP